jgi:hypothetical protein
MSNVTPPIEIKYDIQIVDVLKQQIKFLPGTLETPQQSQHTDINLILLNNPNTIDGLNVLVNQYELAFKRNILINAKSYILRYSKSKLYTDELDKLGEGTEIKSEGTEIKSEVTEIKSEGTEIKSEGTKVPEVLKCDNNNNNNILTNIEVENCSKFNVLTKCLKKLNTIKQNFDKIGELPYELTEQYTSLIINTEKIIDHLKSQLKIVVTPS